jgi:hypothetical protein
VHFEPRTVVPGEQSIELIAPRSAGYE